MPYIDLAAKAAIEALDARIDTLEVQEADDVPYSPTTTGDWDDPDPTAVDGALDDIAGRIKALEDAGSPTASSIDYTPSTAGDWVDPDPSKVDGALDDAAGRIKALEDVAPTTLVVSAAAGAEALNVIEVTLTCVDESGASVASALVLVELLDADLGGADDASQAFDVTTGTAISADTPTSNTAQLVQASGGSIVIDVTDKSTSLVGDMYLRLTPIDRVGPVKLFEIGFA